MPSAVLTKLIIGIAVGTLALAGCSSTDTSREAAGTQAWPLCSDGFTPECAISVPANDTIVVNNGTTIIFTGQNEPVEEITVEEICWSGEVVDDSLTCVNDDGKLLEGLNFRRITVESQGKSWPALSIDVTRTTDTAGDMYMPLPATLSLSLIDESGESSSTIEVACCDESGPNDRTRVQGSTKSFIKVENNLALPDGTPLTVTWKVSDTQNKFWDGSSRPDHAPPQGLQGLEQLSGTGFYQVRTEVADQGIFSTLKPNFTLTPVIKVGQQEIALEPWLMVNSYDQWQMVMDRQTVIGCGTTPSFTTDTPAGPLTYQITGSCNTPTSSFSIKSISK